MTPVIWALNIKNIDEYSFDNYLFNLPIEIQNEILRYHKVHDQKLKLYARLLIQKYCQKYKIPFEWSKWHINENGKPEMPFLQFNISHSGDWVMVAFSNFQIGVDIEQKKKIKFEEIATNFHPSEIEYIERGENYTTNFYEVWTRKEAYLKAKGIGIIRGLNIENCMNDSINDNEIDWHIKTIDFISDYAVAICSTKLSKIEIKIISADQAHLHLNKLIFSLTFGVE